MAGEISQIFMEYDLVRFFFASCNKELEEHLSKTPLNLQGALEYRLQKVVPYVPRFSEALAHATQPENISESMRLLLHLSDSIAHHSMKDSSTDVSQLHSSLVKKNSSIPDVFKIINSVFF